MEAIELLSRFTFGSRKTVSGVKHFYNAHFPGLYSIVLGERDDCLTRAYIAKPGQLHADLQDEAAKFLWHAHGYDFTETTVSGTCTNICVRPGSQRRFNEYEIRAGIATGDHPQIIPTGRKVLMDEFRRDTCGPGGSFSMTADIVHRVTFQPCDRTGWFACVLEEHRHVDPPSIVYSPHWLTEVPDADDLYKRITDSDAMTVVSGLLHSLGEYANA